MRMRSRVVAACCLLAAACSSGADSAADVPVVEAATAEPVAADPTATVVPEPTAVPEPTVTPEAVADLEASVFEIVSTLAADELMGRDNETEASQLAQAFLIAQLELVSGPAISDGGSDGYRYEYDVGTNLIGIIPGTDLADEYVIVGAHYDHIGISCRGLSSTDAICNGAADNAAGVAAAIQVARQLAEESPRRSVIIALWDGEEDGLIGAKRYVADPVVPLAQTVAYINFDIQGAHLSPALAGSTIMVGAETGGEALIDAARAATADSPLDTARLSLIFGQGRSDHAPFASARVPVVFFTDATNGCYHSVADDLDALDFAKLDLQIASATRLAVNLASTDTPPQFDSGVPIASFDDAVELLRLATTGAPDLALLSPEGSAESAEQQAALEQIVQAGPDAFDGAAINTVLVGAAQWVERLVNLPCFPVAG